MIVRYGIIVLGMEFMHQHDYSKVLEALEVETITIEKDFERMQTLVFGESPHFEETPLGLSTGQVPRYVIVVTELFHTIAYSLERI